MTLSTFRRSGAEVATPVWFAEAGGRLYVFTAGDSGKVKRLRHSSRVQGVWRDATARLVSEPAAIERAHAALRAKYGWQMWLTDLFSRLAGRIRRRAWIEISV